MEEDDSERPLTEEEDQERLVQELRKAQRVARADERARRESRSKDNVITCRLDDQALDALDTLVEAGVRSTRAGAASWLIGVGLEANRPLLEELTQTVAEIRRLRHAAAYRAQRFTRRDQDTPEPADQPDHNHATDQPSRRPRWRSER